MTYIRGKKLNWVTVKKIFQRKFVWREMSGILFMSVENRQILRQGKRQKKQRKLGSILLETKW